MLSCRNREAALEVSWACSGTAKAVQHQMIEAARE